MTNYIVAWKQLTREAWILEQGMSVPSGATNVGSFEHTFVDGLGDSHGHVLYQHLREVMYKIGEMNLQLMRVNFVPKPTIDIFAPRILESLPIGSKVGTLIVKNGQGPYVFTETADPDNKFVIEGNVVKLAATVNHDVKTSHKLTVSAAGYGNPVAHEFTFQVKDVVERLPVAPQGFIFGTDIDGFYAADIDGALAMDLI